MMTFTNVPDILPIERLSPYTLEMVEQQRVNALKAKDAKDVNPEELHVRSREELSNVSNFDYEHALEKDKRDFLGRFKLIRKRPW